MKPSAERPRFRLMQGVETGPVDDRGAVQDKERRVDPDQEYEVFSYQGGVRRRLGVCRVEGAAGNYMVVPMFDVPAGTAWTFYATWRIDSGGIASLNDVWTIAEK